MAILAGKTPGKMVSLCSHLIDAESTLSSPFWEDAMNRGDAYRNHGIGVGNAKCGGCGSQWDNKQTSPVGSFKPNGFGVYDTDGNITQWVQDTWNGTFEGAPATGSAWETGDPRRKVMRSGSWFDSPSLRHSGYRNGDAPHVRNMKVGFRIALTL
ncbi:MAG TPA: SUMF1/EgtB/PvdO family nonheme iron enzyme [Stellaceae bacterium]|jgi:formylglycine-generating enzyme required for sulfatase activity|nr:SUMF1/EgtB/PvdO family nonheme iron enzyme [Stellaceae bacterium]